MYTSVLILICSSVLACGITLRYSKSGDIISKIRIPLKPVLIETSLSDMVIIAAPIISGKKAIYHLYNPKGEFRQLDIATPNLTKDKPDDNVAIMAYKDAIIINDIENFKVFNVNQDVKISETEGVTQYDPVDTFVHKTKSMAANDFLIGPMSEDDYGNWILSAYFKNDKDEWVEVQQSITIDILEIVPTEPWNETKRVGDTFEFRFSYSIKDLESCQLIVPKTTVDRFYDRSQIQRDTCGYVLTNVTERDEGMWQLLAVGRITYVGIVNLQVFP